MKNKKTASEIYLTKADPDIKYCDTSTMDSIISADWQQRIINKIKYIQLHDAERRCDMFSRIEKIIDEYLPITDVNP